MGARWLALALVAGCATAGPEDKFDNRPDSSIVVLGDSSVPIDGARPIDAAPLVDATAQVVMSETTSTNVAQGNSFSCNATNVTSGQNSYYRVFTLSDFGVTDTLQVTNVTFSVETAVGTAGTQPATINLGTYSGATGGTTLDLTKITAVNTMAISIPDSTGGSVATPITGTIAGGSSAIVELRIPDGTASGDEFFIGSNNGGENKPGYIMATKCSISTPTTMKSLAAANGLPEPDILVTLTGTH